MDIDTTRLIDRLRSGEFEFELSPVQSIYYWAERSLGHAFFRRAPPREGNEQLLNLGCGPHIFSGWVNADDYAFKRRFRDRAFSPNWHLDITKPWKCEENRWDGVFCEHVIEHVSYSKAMGVFAECLRTLKPGGWIRISVPDLTIYMDFYRSGCRHDGFVDFPAPAVAISFLTQMHLHRSVWDGPLLTGALSGIGFCSAKVVPFGRGTDWRIIKDDPDKRHESLYVEAQKPRGVQAFESFRWSTILEWGAQKRGS